MEKIYFVIISFVCLFGFSLNAKADGLCTKRKYNLLINKANDIEVLYNEEKIIIKNIDQDLLVFYNDTYYEPKNNEVIINGLIKDDNKIKIYGGYDTDCVEEYIKTIDGKEIKDEAGIDKNIILIIFCISICSFSIIYIVIYERRKNEK